MESLNLYQYPWYYGKINRQEAEENLIDRGENEGCYLVRESQTRGEFLRTTLSSSEYQIVVICIYFRYSNRVVSGACDNGQWTISVLDWIAGSCNVSHYLIGKNKYGQFYFEDDVAFDSIVELIEYYKENPENVNFVLTQPCPKEIRVPEKDANDYDLYEIATELPQGENFRREKSLYSGSYSDVWLGHLTSSKTVKVVAKIEKETEDSIHTLIHEASMLKCMKHENVVLLRGVISKPQFHLIFHWSGDTNLLSFLLQNSGSRLSLMDQINIATQIAAGLDYCGRLKCAHRNVKAKSVMINSKDLKCKLGSFKNARTVDEHGYFHAVTEEDKLTLPSKSRIRWMAIEAALHGRFSQASDVWSFAVLLVELFSGGGLPYAGYLTCKVIEEVGNGFRCAKPQACPKEIYEIMHLCWAQYEADRPSFSKIKELLKNFVHNNKEVLSKLAPLTSPDHSRYAPWKHGSVKQQRTTSFRELPPMPQRSPSSPLPPLPPMPATVGQYGYDN